MTRPELTPEIEFLVACARSRMTDLDRGRASAAIAVGIDWNLVLALAEDHGLVPLLHAKVTSGSVQVPPTVSATLHERAARHVRQSLRMTSCLAATLDLFGRQDVPIVPLKGSILAQRVYGSVVMRQIRDVDLLIRDSDLKPAQRLLEGLGYRLTPEPASGLDYLAQRAGYHVRATSPTKPTLELHYYLLSPRGGRRITYDHIAPRLQHIEFMHRRVPFLGPEDLFVYLCEHGSSHAWQRLEWLAAVAELLRSGQVQASPRLTRSIADFEASKRVNAALMLVRTLFGETFELAIVDDRWGRVANRRVVGRLHVPRNKVPSGWTFAYQFLTDPSLAARARRLWWMVMVPNPDDLPSTRLPRAAWPLFAVFRLVGLLRRRPTTRPSG